jgi:HAMP domain-containing protein
LFDEVRGLLVILDARIAEEQKEAFERVEASSRLLLSSLAASVLVIVFMVASIVLGLRQWLLAPIDALRRAVNAVAAGRYDTQIPAVGPKEIVALAGNVEAMRALLVRLVRQNERSWEALAQQGPAVVALRDALTPSMLHASGVVLRGRVDPAEGELAGDWFDSFDLPDGWVGVVVGDVSGHGATAGVFALRLKQLLGAALNSGKPPGEAVEWAVDSLGETDEMFATAVVVVIDPLTGALHYANAGHPEPLLLHRGGHRIPSQPPDSDESRAAAGVLAVGGRRPPRVLRRERPEFTPCPSPRPPRFRPLWWKRSGSPGRWCRVCSPYPVRGAPGPSTCGPVTCSSPTPTASSRPGTPSATSSGRHGSSRRSCVSPAGVPATCSTTRSTPSGGTHRGGRATTGPPSCSPAPHRAGPPSRTERMVKEQFSIFYLLFPYDIYITLISFCRPGITSSRLKGACHGTHGVHVAA